MGLAWLGPEGSGRFPSDRYCDTMVAMKSQEGLKLLKRRGPLPTGKGEPIQVRMQPGPLSALDAWRRTQEDLPGRPEAIRRLVEIGLPQAGPPDGFMILG